MIGFPVFCGTGSFRLAKTLGKVAGGGKTQDAGNLREGKVCFGQKPFSLPDPAGDHIINGRNSVLPLKGMGHVILIDADFLRKQVQGDVFLIVLVKVMLLKY